MYLLGHVGFALLGYTLYEKIRGYGNDRNKIIVAIGSILSDLLDKPIGSLIFQKGRWFGHSLLFQFLIFCILFLIWKFIDPYPEFYNDSKLLYFGATFHLLGDSPGIGIETLFWPFFGQFPPTGQTSFLWGFESQITIISEVFGLLIITMIGIIDAWPSKYWKTTIVAVIGYLGTYSLALYLLI